MKINIQSEEYSKIVTHACEGYPHEVVGILAGNRSSNTVTEVKTLFNERGDTNNRYKVGALTLMRAEKALESQGLEIVGYYHSHPDHPSQYSEYDREHALPNMSYLIVSVVEGQEQTKQSWRLTEDRSLMLEEDIVLN